MLNEFTKALVSFLGIKQGTNLSSYTQLWAAFLLSGTMHALTMLILPAPSNITTEERTCGVMYFFIFQPMAIMIEDFMHWVWRGFGGKTKGANSLKSIVGYCWVICCIWISLPWIGNVMLRMRIGDKPLFPFDLTSQIVDWLLPSV
jgi:hypothetical protein